ncbi:MAG: glycosyltransferase family 2 protein [Candidatus Andersenbacteria bacterium]
MPHLHISVCVPAYNRPADLENLIKSFLTLTYKNSSLLIFDDLGSPLVSKIAQRYAKEFSQIKYYRNKINLGFANNLRQCIQLAPDGIALIMGDDDLFIEPDTLSYVEHAFQNTEIGILKCAPLLFKKRKLEQASPLFSNHDTVTVFKNTTETITNMLLCSINITGLAFRITSETRNFAYETKITMYPHIELLAKFAMHFKGAFINNYLVAGQCDAHDQLNPILYSLHNQKTDILEDMADIHQRASIYAKNHGLPFPSKTIFMNTLTKNLSVFYPFIIVTHGHKQFRAFITKALSINPKILRNPFTITVLVITIVTPRYILIKILLLYKYIKLRIMLSRKYIAKINKILARYS